MFAMMRGQYICKYWINTDGNNSGEMSIPRWTRTNETLKLLLNLCNYYWIFETTTESQNKWKRWLSISYDDKSLVWNISLGAGKPHLCCDLPSIMQSASRPSLSLLCPVKGHGLASSLILHKSFVIRSESGQSDYCVILLTDNLQLF